MLLEKLDYASASVAVSLPDGFEKGQVYTPEFLARWVASLLKEQLGGGWSGRLLDPACGDGELLKAAKQCMPKARLYGVDIDPDACRAAAGRLNRGATLKTYDMLASPVSHSGLRPRQVDAIVSNPPWGADLFHSSQELKKSGYALASGQFDSWSLFIEKSLKILKHDGVAVFILPDAIFLPEHIATRKLISEQCAIEVIARLGEGIFKNVCRGTMVLLVRKRKPRVSHKVEVFRMSKSQRSAVISGKKAIHDIRGNASHRITQERFLADKKHRWDIDIRKCEQGIFEKIEHSGGQWTELLAAGRGIELSKRGVIKVCGNCGYGVPAPVRPRQVTCQGCGRAAHSEDMLTQRIVELEASEQDGFMPLVVGEDVGRYALSCSRRIRLGVPGINYKNHAVYHQERLLVRKTGVGLKATVTRRTAASNQVVFHYTPKDKKNTFFLYYVLGVLSSRIMFAYHLKKSGESEWRTHPYITPKALKELPIPAPSPQGQSWRQAKAIAARVKKHLREGGKNENQDLEIEGLVAGLYGLGRREIEWAKGVICSAQNLEPMRTLGGFDCGSVEPVIVP